MLLLHGAPGSEKCHEYGNRFVNDRLISLMKDIVTDASGFAGLHEKLECLFVILINAVAVHIGDAFIERLHRTVSRTAASSAVSGPFTNRIHASCQQA